MLSENFSNTLFEADAVARARTKPFTNEEIIEIESRNSFSPLSDNPHINRQLGIQGCLDRETAEYFTKFGLK